MSSSFEPSHQRLKLGRRTCRTSRNNKSDATTKITVKDLPEQDYQALAREILRICRAHQVSCILHSFVNAAMELDAEAIHLPPRLLREMTDEQKRHFTVVGASCHSVEDALEAQHLGCTYITAGHIFETSCKKGLPGRGLNFLETVCRSVRIPVYAIGGVSSANIAAVRGAGAKGACVMSGLMQCEDAADYLKRFEKVGETNAI